MRAAVPGPQFAPRKCPHVNSSAAQRGVCLSGALVSDDMSGRGGYHIGALALMFIQDRRKEMPDLVGRGRLAEGTAARALETKDRRVAGTTAPAHGLVLEKVHLDLPEGAGATWPP